MPPAALIQQILLQPDDSPRPEHVFRRDPALGQVPGQQVHPKMTGVGLVGLGVPLAAAQRGGVSRLGQVRDDPRSRQLLGELHTASRCTPPARNARRRGRRTGPARPADAPGRPAPPGPPSLPRSRCPDNRRSTAGDARQTRLRCYEGTSSSSYRKLGQGPDSLSPHVVDAATTDAGEVPSHGIFGPAPPHEHNPLARSLYQSKASSSRNLTSTPGSTTRHLSGERPQAVTPSTRPGRKKQGR